MTTIISSPRPPLNLFESRRAQVSTNWVTIYEVPQYRIPAVGPVPEKFVNAAAIMTGITISNITSADINFSVQIRNVNSNANTTVVLNAPVPAYDFVNVDLNRQVLMTGESIQVRTAQANGAHVHMSFILNQREEYQIV